MTTTTELATLDDALAVVNMAKPTPAQLAHLRLFLREHPDTWRKVSTILNGAANAIIKVHGGTPGQHAMLQEQCNALWRTLGGDTATPLEALLIDAVVAAWARLGYAEFNLTRATSREHTLTIALHCEKRLSAAQRRYLRAVTTLAQVRRLAVATPGILVAVQGQAQVNVHNIT